MLLPIFARITEEPYSERPFIKKMRTMPMETLRICTKPGWNEVKKEAAKLLRRWVHSAIKEPDAPVASGTSFKASDEPKTTAVTFFIMKTDKAVAKAVQPMRENASR